MKVTRIVEMQMPIPAGPDNGFIAEATPTALRAIPWLYPHFVDEQDRMLLSIHALLVEAPVCGWWSTPASATTSRANLSGGRALATDFLKAFEAAGWTRDSVDAVICTHMHVDHVGWNTMLVDGKFVPTFPNARYLLGRIEFEHWSSEGDAEQQAILADSVQPILDAGLAEFVGLDHVVSPNVRLVPTTGHTPGPCERDDREI